MTALLECCRWKGRETPEEFQKLGNLLCVHTHRGEREEREGMDSGKQALRSTHAVCVCVDLSLIYRACRWTIWPPIASHLIKLGAKDRALLSRSSRGRSWESLIEGLTDGRPQIAPVLQSWEAKLKYTVGQICNSTKSRTTVDICWKNIPPEITVNLLQGPKEYFCFNQDIEGAKLNTVQ